MWFCVMTQDICRLSEALKLDSKKNTPMFQEVTSKCAKLGQGSALLFTFQGSTHKNRFGNTQISCKRAIGMTADSSQHSRAQKTWEEHSVGYDEIKAQYRHTQPDLTRGLLGVDTEEQSVHGHTVSSRSARPDTWSPRCGHRGAERPWTHSIVTHSQTRHVVSSV